VHALILIGLVLLGVHLLGGAFHHSRARRHGRRFSLVYVWGRGWYGSVRAPGGFRIGHRL
jgi:hypothetical protein